MIIFVFGLPGSGKSYFASHLANMINADYINSDRIRREMFHNRTYSIKERLSVYNKMQVQMKEAVRQHKNVVLDATFYNNDIRKNFLDESKDIDDVIFIEVRAEESLIKERLKRSRLDSEATLEVYKKNFLDVQEKFNDLCVEKDYLQENLNSDSSSIISRAVDTSNTFIERNKERLEARLKAGFFRDGHGDLHSRNIFLLPSPQPFDCIEFNDDYRQIDVLNEIAFLCMDVDAFGRRDLSDLFLGYYNNLFPSIKTEADHKLFIYYKSYRSNIRAKVNSLRARDVKNDAERKLILSEVDKYLNLMDGYIKAIGE